MVQIREAFSQTFSKQYFSGFGREENPIKWLETARRN